MARSFILPLQVGHSRTSRPKHLLRSSAQGRYRLPPGLGAGEVSLAEHGAVLDTDLLLGDVLADREKKYIIFNGDDFTTAIERDTLVRTTSLRRMFIDVAAYVGVAGLHVRWRGGRGGYNWKPRFVAPVDRERVVTVELRPPVRAAVPRPGAWLGELLQEMGFAV
jgi:hypothetical protein